jgi:hypothetical protein
MGRTSILTVPVVVLSINHQLVEMGIAVQRHIHEGRVVTLCAVGRP